MNFDTVPVSDVTYNGRPLPASRRLLERPGRNRMDVRRFVWCPDAILAQAIANERQNAEGRRQKGEPTPASGHPSGEGIKRGNDEIALLCQRAVCRRLEYRADTKIGADEYWQLPSETYWMAEGDCEDGAILMASVMRCCGIPADRVRIAAGDVDPGQGAEAGGHAWVCYRRETDGAWVPLDWCYYQDPDVAMADKRPLTDRVEYFRGERIWFAFNDQLAWSAAKTLELGGRLKGSKGWGRFGTLAEERP